MFCWGIDDFYSLFSRKIFYFNNRTLLDIYICGILTLRNDKKVVFYGVQLRGGNLYDIFNHGSDFDNTNVARNFLRVSRNQRGVKNKSNLQIKNA